jgi:hypothetical protein
MPYRRCLQRCQMPDGIGIDLLIAIGFADFGQQITKGEALVEHALGDAERPGNLRDAAPFLNQPGKGLPLRNLIGIEPGNVLDQRGFERRCVVSRLHDGAGQRFDLARFIRRVPLIGNDLGGKIAPSSASAI